jgi:ankyrin repeat protein
MSFQDETLHSAIWKEDYSTSKELVKKCSPDTPDQLGRRPLHLAAERGHQQMVKDLLRCNVDLNAQCDYWQTALHHAAWTGSVDVDKLLLNGTRAMILDKDGNTALHIASQMGFADVVRHLITPHTLNMKGYCDLTPLHCAAMNGHIEVAELLINAEIGVNDMHFGWTPLHCAVDSGDKRVVKLLIDHGANVNSQDKMVGWTPLYFASTPFHWAMYYENGQIVRLLVAAGANKEAVDEHGFITQDRGDDKDLQQLSRVTSKGARRKYMLARMRNKPVETHEGRRSHVTYTARPH